MKAWMVEKIGAPMELREVARPEPGPGEVLVRIRACGINFADLLMLEGRYQETPPVPFVPGMELSGRIEALGPEVRGLSEGDRVAIFSGSGGLAEHGCFPAARCLKLPAPMPHEEAAAFAVAYGTSHLALFHRAGLRAGERVLVLGAAGGVGLTAVELAAGAGAEVIAVARGPARLEVARRAGAAHLLDSDSADIAAEVKALGGADVVFDPVGGALFDAAMRASRPEARLIVIGFASGEIPRIPANILLVKNLTAIGHYWGGYMRFAPEVLKGSLAELLSLYERGKIRPHVSHVVPFAEAPAALDLLRRRKATGKVVVAIP